MINNKYNHVTKSGHTLLRKNRKASRFQISTRINKNKNCLHIYIPKIHVNGSDVLTVHTRVGSPRRFSYLQWIKARNDSPVLHLAALGRMRKLALSIGAWARSPLKLSTHLQRQPFRVPHVSHIHRHLALAASKLQFLKIPKCLGCAMCFSQKQFVLFTNVLFLRSLSSSFLVDTRQAKAERTTKKKMLLQGKTELQ